MRRKIEPYLQGELDSLCGIHAIINALYALFPDMMDREAQRLFQKLLEEVGRKQPDALRIAWRGMNQALLRHLISYSAGIIARDRSVARSM